jgi:ankyrin repeat protein
MELRLSCLRRGRNWKITKTCYSPGPAKANEKAQCTTTYQRGLMDGTHNIVSEAPFQSTQTIDPSLLVKGNTSIQHHSQHDAHISLPRTPPWTISQKELTDSERHIRSEHQESSIHKPVKPSSLSTSPLKLERTLGNIYSRPYLEDINDILSYSSTGSWSSSWSSSMSCVSPQKSIESSSIGAARPLDIYDRKPDEWYALQDIPKQLSNREQMVWDELIDDSHLMATSPDPPVYHHTSLVKRSCCKLKLGTEPIGLEAESGGGVPCRLCGFALAHLWATQSLWCSIDSRNVSRGDVNKRDNFNNTPLHFFAASGNATFSGLVSMFGLGANVHVKNTSGETFMHVLNLASFDHAHALEDYLRLVRQLLDMGFNFQQRDYHGRTIPHVFFKSSTGLLSNWRDLKALWTSIMKIFALMEIDISDFDSSCNSILTIFREWLIAGGYILQLDPLFSHFKISSQMEPNIDYASQSSFSALLQRYGSALYQKNNTEDPIQEFVDLATDIDAKGDTPLIAILKIWPDNVNVMLLKDLIQRFIEGGAEIHMRDKEGDTVLTIACRRGLRTAATALLKLGANVHVRNHKGQGILSQSKTCLWKANFKGDDKAYAGILSCMNAITDAGAKRKPTEIDEWSSSAKGSSKREKVMKFEVENLKGKVKSGLGKTGLGRGACSRP